MSLSTVLAEIKKTKPVAEMDVHAGPRETYQGREGLKRNARERLKDLKEDYITELRLSSIFILVSGSDKDQFSELADKNYGCFVADPLGFYKSLADRLPAELYTNKPTASNLFDIMGRHLEDKANEMKLVSYPQLTMKSTYLRTIKDKDDFVDLIKEAVNEQVGPEIVGIHTVRSLADSAIESGHDSKYTPIVMATDDDKLLMDLHNNLGRVGIRSFLVLVGKGSKLIKTTEGAFLLKEANEETVKNNLTNISNLCKNR